MGADVSYWDRVSPYTDTKLTQANAVVVILPNNKWSMDIDDIPRGTQGEILKADNLHIPIYLAYMNAEGIKGIYVASLDDTDIIGVKGSSQDLKSRIDACKPKPVRVEEHFDYELPPHLLSGEKPFEFDKRWLYLCK